MIFILNSVESHNTIQNTSLLVARAYLTSSDGCSDRSYFAGSLEVSHHSHPLSHEAPNSTDPADADHYPDSKRSVWTDITHRVLQLPLPSAPTASLFGSQITAADIATGEDGSRGVFFFFSDIGIRVSGQFKLRIVISRMPQE
ncbi:hypothetical protein BASA60_011321 [Batrachochytrium salamandrivorans]|nr:hypothetical protein BASA60_011321 [Batrachochytrium salamandrivorans]